MRIGVQSLENVGWNHALNWIIRVSGEGLHIRAKKA